MNFYTNLLSCFQDIYETVASQAVHCKLSIIGKICPQ